MNFGQREEKIIHEARERAEGLYRNGDYLCSEAVFTVVNDYPCLILIPDIKAIQKNGQDPRPGLWLEEYSRKPRPKPGPQPDRHAPRHRLWYIPCVLDPKQSGAPEKPARSQQTLLKPDKDFLQLVHSIHKLYPKPV